MTKIDFLHQARSNEDRLNDLKSRFRYGPIKDRVEYDNLIKDIANCEDKRHTLCVNFKSRTSSLDYFEIQELWEYYGYLSFDLDTNIGSSECRDELMAEKDRVLRKCFEQENF